MFVIQPDSPFLIKFEMPKDVAERVISQLTNKGHFETKVEHYIKCTVLMIEVTLAEATPIYNLIDDLINNR